MKDCNPLRSRCFEAPHNFNVGGNGDINAKGELVKSQRFTQKRVLTHRFPLKWLIVTNRVRMYIDDFG